jgi:hypothetical protein
LARKEADVPVAQVYEGNVAARTIKGVQQTVVVQYVNVLGGGQAVVNGQMGGC